jgi:hypothetical protein
MVRILADGGSVSYQRHPTTSSPSSTSASRTPHGTRSTPTSAALTTYRPSKQATQQNLETALWNEALSEASATRLLNDPAAYRAEAAELQQEYGGSLPKRALDKLWASAVVNARVRYDQGPTTRALQQYGNAKRHSKTGPAPNSALTGNAQRAAWAEVMDEYMARHGQYFVPGTGDYASEEAKALADPKGLAAAEQAFEHAQNAALPKGVQPSDLVGFAKGGELDAAIAVVGRSKPGSRGWNAATGALSTDGFDEEVMNYEFANHEGYAAPGSAQWNIDAENLLGNSNALTAARDAVAVAHANELPSGLKLRQFGADLWAGETAAQAQLTQQRDEHPPLVCTPNEPDQPPLSALDRQKQGEWDALTSLSDALNNLPSSGIDPTLARQALMVNGYVQGLAGQVNQTMQAVGASNGNTPADAIAFLDETVKSSRIDPQLATMVVSAAAPTLHSDLKALSSASGQQAAQGFVSTAGIYYTLQLATQASVPGAASLANSISLWSYLAANSTNSTITVFSSSPSPLAQMLQQLLSTAQQQKVVPNLFHAWVGLTQTKNYAPVNNGLQQQNATAWSGFQQTLNTTRQLDYVQPPPVTPLTTPSPVQSAQQVHGTYDQAAMALEQNGDLPSNIDPAAAAAVQIMMSAGYVAGDEVALARAMIAGNTQQLDAAWLQQHADEGLTMPVDFFTAQAAQQVTGLQVVSASAVNAALKGMEAPLPTAPSYATIARTNNAFAALEAAKASGNQQTVATAQQAMNEAIANELLSVYPDQFPGSTLLTNDENSDWRILAEEQVASDHAGDPQLASQLPALLEAGEITQAGIFPYHDAQSVAALDALLAPFQQPGADPGNAIDQAVLNDARVRDLIGRQVTAATTGIDADPPTTVLAREAAFLSAYEQNDPNGPVAQQIVAGTIAAPVTQRILANAQSAAARNHDPLATAAPLMQAAQDSPSLTLAIYDTFNLPAPSHQAPGVPPPNQLVEAAGHLRSAKDYRNAAIIYAALPDNPQADGVTTELTQAQADKVAIITGVGRQFRTHSVAAQDIKSWIRTSFKGANSAPDWLAQDLADGYHYQQGSKINSVGALKNPGLMSAINAALYQSTGNTANASATPPSPDFIGRQNTDGLTLQTFTSQSALESYVGAAYGLRPSSGSGTGATYNLNTIVYGQTTLGAVIKAITGQAKVGAASPTTPVVLQASPVEMNGELVSAFRVQTTDGSQVWIGPGGKRTPGWAGLDTALTQDRSNTVVQVVGGVSEANAQGNANPLLKTDTPPPPPAPHHSMWLSIIQGAAAMVVGAVLAPIDPLLAAAAAFMVYQTFDFASHDGNVTLYNLIPDALTGKSSWHELDEFADDSRDEAVMSLADGFGPEAGSEISDLIGARFVAQAGGAAAQTTAEATADALTWGQRALATSAGVTANQLVQAGAQTATAAIDLKAEHRLTWGSIGNVALQQAASLVPAAITGGISGVLGRSLIVQVADGYGSQPVQTEFTDRLFEHRNLDRDDLITAAIYTPAGTVIHLSSRPLETWYTRLTAARAPQQQPAGQGTPTGTPQQTAGGTTQGQGTPTSTPQQPPAGATQGQGTTSTPQQPPPGPTPTPGTPATSAQQSPAGQTPSALPIKPSSAPGTSSQGPALVSVEFGDRNALAGALNQGQFSPGQDRAYIYRGNTLLGYAKLDAASGRPRLVWESDGAPATSPLKMLRKAPVSIIISDASPQQVAAGEVDVVPHSAAAMAYRANQRAGGLDAPVDAIMSQVMSDVSSGPAASRQADRVALESATELANDAATRAARQKLEQRRIDALARAEAERVRALISGNADTLASEFADQQTTQTSNLTSTLDQVRIRLDNATNQVATLAARLAEMQHMSAGEVDRYSYKRTRQLLRVARSDLARAERAWAAAQGKPTAGVSDLRARFLDALKTGEGLTASTVRKQLVGSIRDSDSGAKARQARAVTRLRPMLTDAAIAAAQQAIADGAPQLQGLARQAALDALREPSPGDPADAMLGVVTDRATTLANDAARQAAQAQARTMGTKAMREAIVAAGEAALDREFADGQVPRSLQPTTQDAVLAALQQQARRGLLDDAAVGRARQAAKVTLDLSGRAVGWADQVRDGGLIRRYLILIGTKRAGSNVGGFYEERSFWPLSRSDKLLLKQPVDPAVGDGRDVALVTVLNNQLLRLGMGADHVSDVRVVDMRLRSNDPPTYGVGSRLIADVIYPEDPGSQGQDAAHQTELRQRFLSADAARRNGLYDYFGMMLLTGASDQDPVGNHSIGFTKGLLSRGDKVRVLDVDSALGFLPDGSYRALPQTVDEARAQIQTMIDELRSAGVFRSMDRQDQANSVNNALHNLSNQDILDAVDQIRGKIPDSQLNEIRLGLLARRESLEEMFGGQQNVALRTASEAAPRRRYATSLSDIRLSPEHERFWSLPRRFAEPRRLARAMAWDFGPARTAMPDADYYSDPARLAANVRRGVQVKEVEQGPMTRFAAMASLLGLAGFGYYAAKYLGSSWSDYFSTARGFLNIFKIQAKIRTVALAAVRRQTDIPTLITELQYYHIGVEHTLDAWTRRLYHPYLTVSGDAKERLQVATESVLGQLARIPADTPDDEMKKQVAVLLGELFAAHNKIMGVNTANLHFFSQASNAGALLQLGLVLGYAGSIAIDVRGFITDGVPRGLQWLSSGPEYIGDLGKIGSLLNAASATWGRLSEKFPFSPNKSATLTKLAKFLEPYGSLLQGASAFLEAAISLTKLQTLESPVEDIKAAFKFLASWGYTNRGLEHWRKGSAEEQARAAAASSTGSAGEVDTGEVAELVSKLGESLS